jgi:hypothetical protein
MNARSIASAAFKLGIKVRTAMLIFYAGIAVGCFLMVAWVYMLAFAAPKAVALLQMVQAV